jgi:hypothetical protein
MEKAWESELGMGGLFDYCTAIGLFYPSHRALLGDVKVVESRMSVDRE